MKKLVPLALLAALVALPGFTALSSPQAPAEAPALDLTLAPVTAEPLMSVDTTAALAFVEEGWCTSKLCYTYCGEAGGYYIGGSVPCICCA